MTKGELKHIGLVLFPLSFTSSFLLIIAPEIFLGNNYNIMTVIDVNFKS